MIEACTVSESAPLTPEDVEIYLLRVPARATVAYRRAHRSDMALLFMASDQAPSPAASE